MNDSLATRFILSVLFFVLAFAPGCVSVDEYGDLDINRPKFGRNTSSLEGVVEVDESGELIDFSVESNSKKTTKNFVITGQDIDTSGLLPRALVNVQNKTPHRKELRYRFSWYDNRGLDISTGGDGWISRVLDGRQEVSLTDAGPNKDATKYKIQIRSK